MEKKWFVYMHVNKVNGKKYVGITSKPKPEHRWNGGRGYRENPHFFSAIQAYGWDGFEHKILLRNVDERTAKTAERMLISILHTQDREFGYNATSGGDGTPGCHPSDETRQKLSRARRKENLSDETLRRRSEGLKGRHFSSEHRKKIGDGNSKQIKMYAKDGTFIKSFRAARDAEVELGVSHTHISQCCNGKRNTAGGYIWKFA